MSVPPDDSDRPAQKPRTKLVHAGRKPFEQFGFVNTPTYRGSAVLYPDTAALYARTQRYTYGTKGTPTTDALEIAWTEISGAAGTVLAPSGLAAITVALLTAVKAGDHVLITDSVYRPTRHFSETILKRFGVETTFFDPLIGDGIAALMRPNTTVVFVEAPGSQSFEMQDIPTIAAVAHDRGACVIMDNTWATPLFFPPHTHGVDMAVEAGTKYLSGHSDLLLGMVSANETWWPRLRETFDTFSMTPGAEDVFLGLRGLRTWNCVWQEAQRQGFALAKFLQARPEVSRVLHPGLPEDPGHAIWRRDFSGASGLFSVILKPASKAAVATLLDGLDLFGLGYSWGGYESLVIPFDCASYRSATEWAPEGPALRFSIGLEDADDLMMDLDRGFARMRASGG